MSEGTDRSSVAAVEFYVVLTGRHGSSSWRAGFPGPQYWECRAGSYLKSLQTQIQHRFPVTEPTPLVGVLVSAELAVTAGDGSEVMAVVTGRSSAAAFGCHVPLAGSHGSHWSPGRYREGEDVEE